MRYWIVPNDGKLFNTEKALVKNGGFIDWRAGNRKFAVGDIVFIYKSRPESCIRHMLRVVKKDIEESFDQKIFWSDYKDHLRRMKDSKYVRLELLKTLHDNSLCLAYLRKYGLCGNLQGTQTCFGDLLDYILDQFDGE